MSCRRPVRAEREIVTFLAAMRACPELPDTASIEAWLVTIAHRKAIDVLRAQKRHAVR